MVLLQIYTLVTNQYYSPILKAGLPLAIEKDTSLLN